MADITKYYSLTNALKQYGQVDGEVNPNATTMQDMQSYMQQNGDTLENVVKAFLWQPETNVVAGQEVHSPNLPAGYMAVCTTAGTTGTTEPSWSTSYSTYTDGTVTWAITSLYSGKLNITEAESTYLKKNSTDQLTITKTGERHIVVKNNASQQGLSLEFYNTGNRGLYDYDNNKWLICYDNDGNVKSEGCILEKVVASGNGYIRYFSGVQICWGTTGGLTANTAKTITLAASFKDSNYVVAALRNAGDTTLPSTMGELGRKRTTSNFEFASTGSTNYTYIAIGLWK